MMRLFVNALAASGGGGLTYVRNTVPHLAERTDVRTTLLVSTALQSELGVHCNIEFITAPLLESAGAGRRFWYEQCRLPELIRHSNSQVLLSTGNFALWNSPVPQILLSRNALYTSNDFQNDLRRRGDYRLWLDTQLKAMLARASIQRAEMTVAPTEAFAKELREWTGCDVRAINHGFDVSGFTADQSGLPVEMQSKLDAAAEGLRLLFVSHYNYYRNFEMLIRALPLLRLKLAPRKVRLVLTCDFRPEANPGSYLTESTVRLINDLGVSENVVELGSVPYRLLHHVYRACDLYVTPAYAESFAHPLIEAMSAGLPLAASDLGVHREICGDAALYFDRFSPESAASVIARMATDPILRQCMSHAGARRCRDFSWQHHVDRIVSLSSQLIGLAGRSRSAAASFRE